MNDFFDINNDNQTFKARIINNNLRLSKYESEMTELQFVNEKLNEITNLLQTKNSETAVQDIIENSLYNSRPVLQELLSDSEDIASQIEDIRGANAVRQKELEKEFKAIQIATQNIISLNSSIAAFQNQGSEGITEGIEVEEALSSINLDNRRVMDLIS
jgi:uncharacterized membrane protein YccC